MERAKSDSGFAHVLFLLDRSVLAARETDFAIRLGRLGIVVSDNAGLYEFTAGFAAAVQQWHGEGRIRRPWTGSNN